MIAGKGIVLFNDVDPRRLTTKNMRAAQIALGVFKKQNDTKSWEVCFEELGVECDQNTSNEILKNLIYNII